MVKKILSVKIFFYLGVLPALIFQSIGAWLYFFVFADSNFAAGFYSITKILILVWPLLFLHAARRSFLPWPHAQIRRSVLLGIISGIIIIGAVFTLFFTFRDTFLAASSLIKDSAASLGVLKHYFLFAIFLSVFHSLLEEYFWRWFVFRGLMMRFRFGLAALLGSFAFAAHHYFVLARFFPLGITLILGTVVWLGGVLWCAMYYKTKSIIGSFISHFCADVAVMTVGYWLIVSV